MRKSSSKPSRDFKSVPVPLWREVLFGVDWLALRASPIYYGLGIPHGDGAPVILIPGFLGSDRYLTELYYWLQRIGYRPFYSGIGQNTECPEILMQRLFKTMDGAYRETGRKLHLIGHSLGGLMARSAAVRRPHQVAQVIAMASPLRAIHAHGMALTAAGFVRGTIISRHRRPQEVKAECYTGHCTCDFVDSLFQEFPASVPRAAIYTKTDGVVEWRACLEEEKQLNFEVPGTHIGLAFNPQAYRRLALLLAAVRRARLGREAETSVP